MGLMPTIRVVANNKDISSAILGRFISLSLTDAVGMESDLLEIMIEDADPVRPIQLPETGAEIELFMGYDGIMQRMGLFICDEVELAGWPGEMTIRARAAVYQKSKGGKTDLQTQKTRSWKAKTKIGDMVKKIADEHGLKPVVAQSLAAIELPHTDQADESDLNLLIRIARKYDAIVKPADGKLVLAKRGETKTASGQSLAPVKINATQCTRWRMALSKRETAGMIVAYWHAVKNAKRKEVKVGKGEPVRRMRNYYPTEEMALAAARAELARRERGQQTLALSVIGDPAYSAEAPLTTSGFRPDVDGEWLISRVTHRIDVSGYLCEIEAEKPNPTEDPAVEVKED